MESTISSLTEIQEGETIYVTAAERHTTRDGRLAPILFVNNKGNIKKYYANDSIKRLLYSKADCVSKYKDMFIDLLEENIVTLTFTKNKKHFVLTEYSMLI